MEIFVRNYIESLLAILAFLYIATYAIVCMYLEWKFGKQRKQRRHNLSR